MLEWISNVHHDTNSNQYDGLLKYLMTSTLQSYIQIFVITDEYHATAFPGVEFMLSLAQDTNSRNSQIW